MNQNKNIYFIIVLVVLFLVLNLFLYSRIFGSSFLLYFFLVILCTGVGFFLYYFFRFHYHRGQKPLRPAEHFVVRQESALNREISLQNMQSQAVKTIERTNFLLHKRIIFTELIIILILFILLIVRI